MTPVLCDKLVTLSLLVSLALTASSRTASATDDTFPAPVPAVELAIVDVPPPPSGPASHRFIGSAGCSATSCHGGRSLPGGELAHWAKFDTAHRRAFEVLSSDLSLAMARKLGIKSALEDARCLACHVAPDVHRAEVRSDTFAFEHGVGCESCHGAASEWVTAHIRPDWKSWSRERKSAAGYRDLKSMVTRTETCVACHVGSPVATVDHDLIAAGHPRLLFDMGAFHDQLPKHWDERSAVRREPDQELRLWLIGQAASTQALSEITASRADLAIRSGADRLVPDLAEWDCHACHHDLADENWRGTGHGLKSLGAATWGSWIVPSARVAARESKALFGRDGAAAAKSLDQLTGLIQPSRFRSVSAANALKLARQSANDADVWLRSLDTARGGERECSAFLNRLLSPESDSDWSLNWDGQAQRYLGLVAAWQSVRDLSGDDRASRLSSQHIHDLRDRLRYPPSYATPKAFRPDDVQRLIRNLRGE